MSVYSTRNRYILTGGSCTVLAVSSHLLANVFSPPPPGTLLLSDQRKQGLTQVVQERNPRTGRNSVPHFLWACAELEAVEKSGGCRKGRRTTAVWARNYEATVSRCPEGKMGNSGTQVSGLHSYWATKTFALLRCSFIPGGSSHTVVVKMPNGQVIENKFCTLHNSGTRRLPLFSPLPAFCTLPPGKHFTGYSYNPGRSAGPRVGSQVRSGWSEAQVVLPTKDCCWLVCMEVYRMSEVVGLKWQVDCRDLDESTCDLRLVVETWRAPPPRKAGLRVQAKRFRGSQNTEREKSRICYSPGSWAGKGLQ